MRLAVLPSLLALGLLTSCETPTAASDPYGTWVGKLVTDEGQCPTDELSAFRVRGNSIVFNPGLNSSVLRGSYKEGDQHYHAELVDKGMNNTPYRQVFDGYPVGQGIGGTLQTPRCRAHITLVRR
ncbi:MULTISPECIES: hypothetical protein [Saccharibacter]|uniref:Lipoprotein n=1 Tax=Saccharibacter floricola DSM 15669 TaxID=1123227 RepID=A0ABQ0NZS4_9PROT|nr:MULTISPECIES: hypothetical protein [Saccharibacter]MXV36246.1 hypothetical protein [Saccharibacter sp. EH611]MXV57106.1 hypothetical protein [Saccharibacter sp. EH70]MXV66534.1 hypothetical protein [Saccharibacter sp. EH60]GBQ07641.1 hypothetical protein AA15669_1465 [Saccharibacter floricola DSM 15669]